MVDAIVAEGLGRRFGAVVAVERVDLRIAAGEIYGFLGPNGAGKTTCVRMLCTLLAPTAGRAFVAGHDVTTEPNAVRLRIGVALQGTAVDPKQTGREFLDLQGRLYGLSAPTRAARLEELAAMIDIGEALDRRISTYSGGMARRLDLAGALVHQPDVVFLDEPTSGLDPASRARVWEEIARLNRQLGTTIFLTTQYLEEADELAHRVGIIDRGRIVAEGTPDDLKRRIGADVICIQVTGDEGAAAVAVTNVEGVTRVETAPGELIATTYDGARVIGAVAVALHQTADVTLRSLSLRRPTLDDVFLEMTGGHLRADEVSV
jgi:ABC-2 type transport system ATP-binding protein